jgi:hypothetical protein
MGLLAHPFLLALVTGLAAVAQSVERVLGKDEVMGSSPISSSFFRLARADRGE